MAGALALTPGTALAQQEEGAMVSTRPEEEGCEEATEAGGNESLLLTSSKNEACKKAAAAERITVRHAQQEEEAMLSTRPEEEGCEEATEVGGNESLLLTSSKNEACKKEAAAERITVRHVVFVVVVALTCVSQGTATKGWTAVLPKMQDASDKFPVTDDDVAWLVSMTSIVGIFASLCTGPLVECAGPRRALTVTVTLSTALWLLMAFPPNKTVLFIARGGLAACVYIISTISLPLLAELSPSKIRGSMTALAEVAGAIGVLVGYLLAYLFSWHLATALCTLTSALLVLPMLLVPESPYWLVRRGRTEAARTSLQRLMGSKAAVENQLSAITSRPTATQASRTQQFTELAKGRNARPVLLVLSFFALRELGGRSCIMMYTVYIFRAAGVELDAFTCTVLVGATRAVCVCLTAALLERTGRRPLLMATAVVGGLAQGACGLFLYLEVPGASWVPLAAVLVYVAAYGIGIGPIPWVYVGELVPSPVRSLGASIITACDAVVVFSINLGFLRLIAHIGLGVTFLIFGALNFLIGVIVWLWIPETKGVPLQELESAFSRRKKNPEEAEQCTMFGEDASLSSV